MALVEQAHNLKNGLIGIVITLWQMVTGLVMLVGGSLWATMRHTQSTAQQAYEATQSAAARRQGIMVQRAAEAELKPTIAKDPLLAQNRALSAFAVLLLLILLTVVVLQTTENDDGDDFSSGSNARWPEAGSTQAPTALFPTEIPTPTPIPDPLRVGGSMVFSLRENGQEDLWAFGVGETGPLRITNHAGQDRDPAWSPDGTRIAFSSNRDGNWELYILQVDTGALTRLTFSQGFEGAPTWSPDSAWIAYEGYYPDTQDLEIYFISTDPVRAANEGAGRITFTPGPDTEPDWSPGGREIAFTSWRSASNQDIFIINLDEGGGDAGAVNLTNTPDRNEDHATWSQDATRIAYTATVDGIEGVYVKPSQQPQANPILVGRGRMPTWSPNSASLAYVLDVGRQSQIITGVPGNFGAATDAMQFSFRASDPAWTSAELPGHLVQSGGVPPNPETSQPLYVETERRQATGLYGLAPLNAVSAPQAYLSDRVNDSFEALRLKILNEAGFDFLGTLEDAFWKQDRPPEPGEERENWHYTGRAFSIDRNLIYGGFPPPLVVVREDIEINTYWRLYLRVVEEAQNGTLGEPLRVLPWDLTARGSGDVDDYERGGKIAGSVPPGYYVDLTRLAEDYDWQRTPALRTWQYNFGAIQFWEFRKTNGLSWNDAMLELYYPDEMQGFLTEATRIPPPPPLPTPSPTRAAPRSPTPIPPDTQQ